MIIHRDYRSSSDSIIKIFDDRVEFYNPGRLPDSITIEDLFTNNYKSTPRNKQVADFCKSLGIVEKYGSGIRRIIDYFAQEKLPKPEFRNISDGFMVTVFSSDKNEKVGEKVGEKLTDNQQKILKLIEGNPNISAAKLAGGVGISVRKIETNIQKLKEAGLLERIGPAKGGYWKLINS